MNDENNKEIELLFRDISLQSQQLYSQNNNNNNNNKISFSLNDTLQEEEHGSISLQQFLYFWKCKYNNNNNNNISFSINKDPLIMSYDIKAIISNQLNIIINETNKVK